MVERSVEEIVEDIVASEPVQHLLTIEYRALATGRKGDYNGQSLKDAITSIITQTLKAERKKCEEVVEEAQKDIARRIFAGDTFELDGKFYKLSNGCIELLQAPTQPNNPK